MARTSIASTAPPSSIQLDRRAAEEELESLAREATLAAADAFAGWELIELVAVPPDPLILGAEAEVDLGYLGLQFGFRPVRSSGPGGS